MPADAPILLPTTASQYAQRTPGLMESADPGTANAYGPGSDAAGGLLTAALPAAGIGALSLYLLYRRKLQDEQEAQKQLPQKQADLQSQLPGLHPKDILLGSALGGGAGLLYDLAAEQKPGEKRLPKALKRILGGAAIGGLGANLVGDRARRYISNTVLPVNYDTSSKLEQLLPGSLQRFIDAAIYDKPSFNANVGDVGMARRELNRIAFGVHRASPDTDYWQQNKTVGGPSYYSVNEQNPRYKQLRDVLFGARADEAKANLKKLLTNPAKIIHRENTKPDNLGWITRGLFGADTLLGGQQVILPPSGTNPQLGRVLDRYDVTPSNADILYATDAAKKLKVLRPSWWSAQKSTDGLDAYSQGAVQTNKQFMGGLLSRLVWDKILTEKHPWISQQFSVTPAGNGWIPGLTRTPGEFQLLREDGTP